jgi:hypothetical protein
VIELLTRRGRLLRRYRHKLFVLIAVDLLHNPTRVDLLHTTGLSADTLAAVMLDLTDAGFITAETETPMLPGVDLPGGPPIRIYQLTKEGRRHATQMATWLSRSGYRRPEGD